MNKKTIIFPITAALMLFTIMGLASACSCIYLEDAKARLDNAAYAFSGEIVDIEISGQQYNEMQEVTVRIIDTFKPSQFPEPVNLKIYAIKDTGSECGYNFIKGEKYLIYAYLDEETSKFTTNACMGNSLLSKSQEEIKELNKLTNSTSNQNNNNQNNNSNNNQEQNIFVRFFSWIRNLFS